MGQAQPCLLDLNLRLISSGLYVRWERVINSIELLDGFTNSYQGLLDRTNSTNRSPR